MKNKLLAVLATLSMVASASAVKVNDNLSINGFIDGSYALTDTGAAKTQALEVDEVELNFVTNVGNVSSLIAVDSDLNDAANTDLGIEQAHFTYNVNDAISLTFGRYGSALGFEREDPSGLYTYSRAYTNNGFNFGDVDSSTFDGFSVAYSGDAYSVAVSLHNASADAHSLETNDLDFEVSFTYAGIAGVNIGGGFTVDNEPTGTSETDAANLSVSRQFGKLFVAGEYSTRDTQANGSGTAASDLDAYMILADYDLNNKLGVALRISSEELSATTDYDKVTIAPNYAITESLGAILEYSDVDNAGVDSEEYAVELTYTF